MKKSIVAAASLLTFAMILIRADGDEPAADGDAKIQQSLEGIYELRPGYVTVYGDWGGSVAVLRGVSSTRGNGYLPDRFAICTVDFKNRKLTSVNVIGQLSDATRDDEVGTSASDCPSGASAFRQLGHVPSCLGTTDIRQRGQWTMSIKLQAGQGLKLRSFNRPTPIEKVKTYYPC